jgi:hypothetical protein
MTILDSQQLATGRQKCWRCVKDRSKDILCDDVTSHVHVNANRATVIITHSTSNIQQPSSWVFSLPDRRHSFRTATARRSILFAIDVVTASIVSKLTVVRSAIVCCLVLNSCSVQCHERSALQEASKVPVGDDRLMAHEWNLIPVDFVHKYANLNSLLRKAIRWPDLHSMTIIRWKKTYLVWRCIMSSVLLARWGIFCF